MGNNSIYEINALVYGTPTDFFYLLPNGIFDINLSCNRYSTALHFDKLLFQPINRCLNLNLKYESCRNIVQVKWPNILDYIISYRNNNIIKNSSSQ